MSFYDKFSELCKQRGVSPSSVAKAIGLTTANPTYWKRGSTPKLETVRKLADYFGVSIPELLDDSPIVFTVSTAELKEDLDKRARWRKGPHARAISALEQMNEQGQSKVADYAEDILPRYRRQDGPQAPAPGDTNTPAAAPPPESTENGE